MLSESSRYLLIGFRDVYTYRFFFDWNLGIRWYEMGDEGSNVKHIDCERLTIWLFNIAMENHL